MFHKARIRLTVWYLFIIMAVSLMFSSIIYHTATVEFTRFEWRQRMRMEQRIQELPRFNNGDVFLVPQLSPTTELIEEAKQRILWILFVLNSGIFFIAGFLGYLLAGRTLKPIQEMMNEQNRFISDAPHELKTPLTSLKSAMEVHLREKHPSKQATETLFKESIIEVDKLHALSDSLLQLAQYEEPQTVLTVEKIKLQEVIAKAIHNVTSIANRKQIKLDVNIDLIEMKGNEQSLIDLFVILLDNAIKYSSVKSIIHIAAKKTDRYVLISIRDEGFGIADKDLDHIFDRFYRADNARSKKDAGGYGLGLAIAKKIVNRHKGTIGVKSKQSEGSTFTIKLPSLL